MLSYEDDRHIQVFDFVHCPTHEIKKNIYNYSLKFLTDA